MHAKHAERKRVGLGENALAEQRGGDWRVERLGKITQLLVGARDHATLARKNHWALGLGDEVGGLLHRFRTNFLRRFWMISRKLQRSIHVTSEGTLRNVLGHIDQHRTGATSGRNVISLAGDARQRVGFLHEVVVLHHRNGDAENISLLEGVLAEHPGHGLTANHQHRHRVHHRGHQAGDGVAGAGAGGHQHRSGAASRAGIAIGHVHRALLVTHEDEFHLRLHRLQGVENRNRGTAGIPENVLDPEIVEGPDERLCAVHGRFAHKIGVGEGKFIDWQVNCNQK